MSWRPAASIRVLQQRARMLAQTRAFFERRDIFEVQTPVLGQHGVTDPDVEAIAVPGYGFLQTSPEYFLKRLLAAGAPSCYQLGPAFRHNERGRQHNPEFTMLEWYRLGFDDQALRTEVSELCDELLGPDAYQTVTYAQLVGDLQRPPAELDLAFADACTDLCPGRFFIVDYPADQAALARLRQDDPAWARRFELVIDGVEVANGYFELTDVQEHRRRFSADAQARRARDLPDREVDPHLLAALEHGLPDCAGVALGFDRLVMLALGLTRLEQVLAFTR